MAEGNMPQKLDELLEVFDMFPDPTDRTGLLLSYSDQFREVPPEIARRPFDKSHQVPQCESDAYVWARKQPDDTLKLYFAVENPSGVSARALAAILDKTLSGLPPAEVAKVTPDNACFAAPWNGSSASSCSRSALGERGTPSCAMPAHNAAP